MQQDSKKAYVTSTSRWVPENKITQTGTMTISSCQEEPFIGWRLMDFAESVEKEVESIDLPQTVGQWQACPRPFFHVAWPMASTSVEESRQLLPQWLWLWVPLCGNLVRESWQSNLYYTLIQISRASVEFKSLLPYLHRLSALAFYFWYWSAVLLKAG
jgi:hypothetical protein